VDYRAVARRRVGGYPMLSLGYVVTAFGAWYLFGEALSVQRLLAIFVILVGVAWLART